LGLFIFFFFLQELLDKCLLGCNNIFAGAYKSMPHAATEMEQLFAHNCQHIDSLLDEYLLGSNNIFADAYKSMPLATTEMAQLFADNCQLIDSLREDMQVQCHQDLSVGSVKKVLISRLEELLEKVCAAMYLNACLVTRPILSSSVYMLKLFFVIRV